MNYDKRAKLHISYSQLERLLGLPKGVTITETQSLFDPAGIVIKIVSEDFTELYSDSESVYLSVQDIPNIVERQNDKAVDYM